MAWAQDDKAFLFFTPMFLLLGNLFVFPAVAALLKRRPRWLWFCTALWAYLIYDFAVDAASVVELVGHSTAGLRREYGLGLSLPQSFLRHGGLCPFVTTGTVLILMSRAPWRSPALYGLGLLAACVTIWVSVFVAMEWAGYR